MSGQITREVGEVLNLEAQLYDLTATMPKRIIADLLNADGSLRGTVELTHVAKGVFVETAETMPNIDTLIVKYYTYESDGTTLSTTHEVAEDKFMLEARIVVGGEVVGSIVDDFEISGEVDETTIEGLLASEDAISGIINDDDLLEGTAYEC